MANLIGNRYNLIKINLKSTFNNEAIDLRSSFEEMYLFESIFDKAMTGNISFMDTEDLLSNFPIIGSESIEVSFTSGDEDELFDREFLITHIDEAEVDNNGFVKRLTLYFMAPHVIFDKTIRLSEKFEDEPHTKIKELLESIGVVNAEIEQTTKLESPVVFPNWTPIQCINFFADTAKTVTEKQGFLFFDSASGVKFMTVSGLTGKPTSMVITYGRNPDFKTKRASNVHQETINKSFDLIEDRLSGRNGQTTHTFDIETKTVKTIETKIKDQEDSQLGSMNIINSFLDGDEKSKITHSWSKLEQGEAQVQEVALDALNSNVRTVLIDGSTNIEAGMIVESRKTTSDLAQATTSLIKDPRQSGASIISSIKYEIGPQEFNMIVELRKDGYENNLLK